MMKDAIVLSSMIDSSIQKLKWGAIAATLILLPLPVMANTVKVERFSTEADEVTLRVSVRDNNNSPIEGLRANQFEIATEGETIEPTFAPKNIKDKAYVVILLDMSGSMKNSDSGNKKQSKLSGAVDAISKFVDQAGDEDIDLKIALVPFGYKGNEECSNLYPVDEFKITEQPFIDVNSSKLSSNLRKLKQVKVCASTDLHKPLLAAKDYLEKQVKKENNLASKIKPKLITILLSDGYDNSDKQKVKELVKELKPKTEAETETPIKVHALGYGESLKNLRDRAQCSSSIPDSELTVQNVSQNCSLAAGDIKEYIIDEYLLQTVAQETGGIYRLSANSNEVAKNLIEILKAEREYKLVYKQPKAERASSHNISVRVTNPTIESASTEIKFPNLAFQKLSPLERSGIFVGAGVLSYVGINSFTQWSRRLKQQADNNLDG